MRDERSRRRDGQSGFALILAIMCLLLLTFLGLTLAASTTTELQIATNYRWSEQAFYNAEAGLEVAKAYLKVLNVNTLVPDVPSGLDGRPARAAGQPVSAAPHAPRHSERRLWQPAAQLRADGGPAEPGRPQPELRLLR